MSSIQVYAQLTRSVLFKLKLVSFLFKLKSVSFLFSTSCLSWCKIKAFFLLYFHFFLVLKEKFLFLQEMNWYFYGKCLLLLAVINTHFLFILYIIFFSVYDFTLQWHCHVICDTRFFSRDPWFKTFISAESNKNIR